MRFSCSRCDAQYTISDEKVRGKVIKVRCKRCNHLLVIRDRHQARPAAADKSRINREIVQDGSLEQEFERAFGNIVSSSDPEAAQVIPSISVQGAHEWD